MDRNPQDAALPLAETLPVDVSLDSESILLAEPLDLPEPARNVEPGVRILIVPTASRRLTESLVVFISAILFLRAVAVEPFGVPTGSMAPTLIGNHKIVTCPRCSYVIRVGEPLKHGTLVACPNCGQADIDVEAGPELAGDRLLVDKNVFSLRPPRRWEPAVFRCPSENMTDQERKRNIPYVKRVVGLPAETVQIIDGDVYINGQLMRKTLAEALAMRVPIFDMNFPPKAEGWTKRWVIESKLPPPEGGTPPDPTLALAGTELRLDGTWATRIPVWIAYKHQRHDRAANNDREETIDDFFVYNGWNGEKYEDPDRKERRIFYPVHDFIAEFEIEVVEGAGAFQCRMWDGADYVVATCPVGANSDPFQLKHDGSNVLRAATRPALEAGRPYRLRMAFVDRRVSFSIDGKEPFAAYDLEPVKNRGEVSSPLAFGVQGINVIVRNVTIYRDIYHRASGRNAVNEPLQLGRDEYFMLGDNSANSDDSRSWRIPGVPERNFLGKPFLLHQPSRITHWAFLGRDRAFQSIDWARIRFLR